MHKELPTFLAPIFLIIRNINLQKVGKTLCELFLSYLFRNRLLFKI